MATSLKVLIVENSENDALLIVDCLFQAGYHLDWHQVETAADLTAALNGAVLWDLILSDYSIPAFGGLAALEIYKKCGRDIPFFLISGSIGEERAVEAMRSGVHDYIMKDRMQRLAPAVDRELREAANRRERRAATDENQRLNSELREKVELLSRSHADLEQVAWAASHDLKEPLRMVTTYSQLLLRRHAAADHDEVEFCGYIGEGVERVTALIDGLVAYTHNLRAPADLTVRTEADAAAREAVRSLAPLMDRSAANITLGALPPVKMDYQTLLDVFQQLFLNALEYCREGVPPCVHVSAEQDRDEIRFSVRDNGIGIEAEHHARIFQLFRRLHGSEHPGIGVGLPRCRRLVENFGGRLWVESEPGVGSTFYFTLSAAQSLADAAVTGR